MLPCLLAGALGVPQAQWQTNDGPLTAPGALDPPERSPSYVMGIVQPGSVFIRGTPKSGTTWLEVIGMELLAEACKTCGGNLSSSTSGGEVISTTRPRQAHEGRDAECKCAQSAHLYGDADKHRVPGHDAVSHPSPYVEKEHLECAEREGGDHLERCLNATAVATSKAACEANYRYLLIERDPRAIAVSWYHYRGGNITSSHLAVKELRAKLQPDQVSSGLPEAVRELCPMAAANVGARHVVHKGRLESCTTFLEYDALLSAPLVAYRRVATALGLSEVVLTDASLAKVIERTSLEMMQRMERDHELPGPNRPGRERAKARAGGDSWKDELDEMSKEVCFKALKQHLPRELRERYEVV